MASVPNFELPQVYPPGIEPAWEVALLFPAQGTWSIDEYLELTERTNQLVEFTAGRIEVLHMPTIQHQLILLYLIDALRRAGNEGARGMALMAPHPTTLQPDKIREPDILFKLQKNLPGPDEKYFQGADLVMEVVSDDPASHNRDYQQNVIDYAEAGIPEYWIVDPQQKLITVLTLSGTQYDTHGVFKAEQTATSVLLADFSVEVSAVFAAAKG